MRIRSGKAAANIALSRYNSMQKEVLLQASLRRTLSVSSCIARSYA